jgi:putative sterol carrier protein
VAPATRLPDPAWCDRVGAVLQTDSAYQAAIQEIGTPLFVKLKDPDNQSSVILRLAAETAMSLQPDGHVSEEGIIVSTDIETWGRLLRGSTDLTTAVMGRDVRASGSMFRLMRIANPAEKILERISAAMKTVGEVLP